jgi:hypothetical protein
MKHQNELDFSSFINSDIDDIVSTYSISNDYHPPNLNIGKYITKWLFKAYTIF